MNFRSGGAQEELEGKRGKNGNDVSTVQMYITVKN